MGWCTTFIRNSSLDLQRGCRDAEHEVYREAVALLSTEWLGWRQDKFAGRNRCGLHSGRVHASGEVDPRNGSPQCTPAGVSIRVS